MLSRVDGITGSLVKRDQYTMSILVSGFEPFETNRSNPSGDILPLLEKACPNISTLELPVSFAKAWPLLLSEIKYRRPTTVICLGLSQSRQYVSIERVALNLMDASICDNDGFSPTDQAIIENGNIAFWSRLPIRQILRVLDGKNIPTRLSESAGTYVCNHIFFNLCHYIDKKQPSMSGGFIHLPSVEYISIETQAEGLACVINDVLSSEPEPEGSLPAV